MTYHNIPYQKLWSGLPLALLTALTLLTACGPADRAWRFVEPAWSPSTTELLLGPVPIDLSASASFSVTQPGETPRELWLELEDERSVFSLVGPSSVEVPVGQAVSVSVELAPAGPGPLGARLWLVDAQGLWPSVEVALTGLVDPDGDEDGQAHTLAGGQDCDDQDSSRHPDAEEIWYDGVDQDCDGRDEDQDGDGVPLPSDCDDQDPERFPGAVEVWYDGVDQDCDGLDDDQDGDGWLLAQDCDDTDPAIHPNQDDLADGVDQDCDGVMDEDSAAEGALAFSELFPVIRSKTTDYDDFLELYLSVPLGLSGWTLQVGDDVSVLEERREAPGSWALLCSAGLAARVPECGVVVEPWPPLSRLEDSLVLEVEGRPIASIAWDASWGLSSHGLQADLLSLLAGGEVQELAAWCEAEPSPGRENLACSP